MYDACEFGRDHFATLLRTAEREDLETVLQRAFGNRLSRLRCLGNISGYAPGLEIVRRDERFETLMEDVRFQWAQCEI